MRILIATHDRGVVGGTEVYLDAVIQPLRSAGHELRILSERSSAPDRTEIGGNASGHIRADEISFSACLEEVRLFAPSVVYLNGLQNCELEESLIRGYPSIAYVHNYVGCCISGRKMHS